MDECKPLMYGDGGNGGADSLYGHTDGGGGGGGGGCGGAGGGGGGVGGGGSTGSSAPTLPSIDARRSSSAPEGQTRQMRERLPLAALQEGIVLAGGLSSSGRLAHLYALAKAGPDRHDTPSDAIECYVGHVTISVMTWLVRDQYTG